MSARFLRTALVAGIVVLAAAAGARLAIRAQAPARPTVQGVDWVGRGVWLRAELHTHTRFSDGSHTVDEVVAAARRNGCDVIAITDHTDGDLKAATPEYLAAIQAARQATPDVTVVTGVEWNVPPGKGREHAGILFPSALENAERLGTFKDRFDDEKKEGDNAELALAALAWLKQANGAGLAPVVMMNHPTRVPASTSAPLITFEALHRKAPDIVAAVEGGPGHQRSDPLGSYKVKDTLVDRWDPMVAQVGGAWDAWLAKGLDVWGAAADADFHNEAGDFWPCEFSSTWIYAPDRTADGIVRAMHAGSYFGEHGHIVNRAELQVAIAGSTRPIIAGQRVTMPAGSTLHATLSIDVPPTDYAKKPNRIDTVELIGISGGKASVLYSGAPGSPEAFSVPVTVPAGGIVLRARGRRANGTSALTFYTNPIRVQTSAR